MIKTSITFILKHAFEKLKIKVGIIGTTGYYIGNAKSLNDADVKLDAALKVVDNAMLTRVAAGNGIIVSDKASKSQKISAKVNGDGGIVNDETGLHLGYIDAGIY